MSRGRGRPRGWPRRTRIQLRGVVHQFRFVDQDELDRELEADEAGEVGGLCIRVGERPEDENYRREILVVEDLPGVDELDKIIHECIHACIWDASEECVTETATDIARLLWRLGWRKARR